MHIQTVKRYQTRNTINRIVRVDGKLVKISRRTTDYFGAITTVWTVGLFVPADKDAFGTGSTLREAFAEFRKELRS